MSKIGIVMGSDSDIAKMSKAAEILEEFGIEYEMRIISAHREPDELFVIQHQDLRFEFFVCCHSCLRLAAKAAR